MSRASTRPPAPTRTASACGWIKRVARLPARSVRERDRNIPASRSARAARLCRSAPTTAMRPASSACGCSPIPTSTRRPPRNGTRSATTTIPTYYISKDLVKPYRVGMSCGFCHVGPNPMNPPADPEHPEWENLSSNVGAQYFWVDRIFSGKPMQASFVFQLFHTSRPGSLDTSLISTDNINNPRTMNAVYNLGPRLQQAKRWGKETLAGGGLDNRQFNDYVKDGPLTPFFEAAEHGLDAARAEGRRRFGRRAWARSTASSSTSACSAKNGCCTSSRWSAASRSRRSRLPTRGRIPATGRPPKRRRRHGAVLSEDDRRPQSQRRARREQAI